MLRGPQTPGELKQRTQRLHAFEGLDEIASVLEELIQGDLVRPLERRPGQKEERFEHLLSEDGAEAAPSPAEREPGPRPDRLAQLEREVADLRREVAELRDELRGPG